MGGDFFDKESQQRHTVREREGDRYLLASVRQHTYPETTVTNNSTVSRTLIGCVASYNLATIFTHFVDPSVPPPYFAFFISNPIISAYPPLFIKISSGSKLREREEMM